jgi:predicted RNase H-like nuclease (RuvC/YqgF family)
MESMLQEARLINSDIGRHSVKCNFSSRLSGRFYQNSSLERNTARKSKLVEMQARKRRLERELRMEEQRVELLEARLNETESCREDA